MQCCGVVGMDHHSLTLVKNIHGLMEIYLLRNVFLRGPTFLHACYRLAHTAGEQAFLLFGFLTTLQKVKKFILIFLN